jgi:DNA ligase-1
MIMPSLAESIFGLRLAHGDRDRRYADLGLLAPVHEDAHVHEDGGVKYEVVAEAYRDLEQASGRLILIDRLAALLAGTPTELLPTVCYLCQGLVAPEFAAVDLGLAEKLALRAVATATGVEPTEVVGAVREAGDLGQAAEQLLAATAADRQPTLEVAAVVDTLHEIAGAAGSGSQGRKLELLAGLLAQATPLEARYLLRLVTGNLRLGIGTPTILDALAQVYTGNRKDRPVLERAYNICCDLGLVAATLASGGLDAVKELRVRPGNPVRVMLAQRLSDADEILGKLGGRCMAEYKYDGMRVQVHRTADGEIELFTRRQERVSNQFPDVVELLQAGVGPREAILEGEIVAYDAAAGELRPFQEVMFRRRKHGIAEAARDVPVGLFCFELLYADGEDFTGLPYLDRRARLAKAVMLSDRLRLTTALDVATAPALEAAFEQAVADGSEGLVCKSTGPGAVYQAGARGWLWIKLKRDYRTELADTIDLVIVGAYAGRGRRRGTYGAVLLAAYDPETELYRTVGKCGTGFSDAELAALPARLAPFIRKQQPARVDSRVTADLWLEPSIVLEVLSAELTLSPNHTAGWAQLKDNAGLSMRFPRFTGRWRDDKEPQDATTTQQLVEMYRTARRAPTG